ncbi:MAG TPA: Gfo/Idh/MocA family oxidoreductase [Vicinamibacterales bacterium]|nr:Gfo/Idh/MocA family oxidoreductase [Vicinamibacterales bacterium]
MNLTPEQMAIGRRNFLKAIAGVPAVAALGAAAVVKGPARGGPVRVGFIGVGGQGRALLGRLDPASADVRCMADINPASLQHADDLLAKAHRPAAKHYVEWRDMLEHEDLEAVIVAVPLWAHADVVCGALDAGKHVLCEKMMAWDAAGYTRMAQTASKSGRVLEIGYQRNYNPIYRSAYEGVIRQGLLGDVHFVRLVWHRNGNWRRPGGPPSPGYDPSKWGYPTWDHLWNWRLYWKYSQGLFAELGSHQVNAANWFLGSTPQRVQASGGIYRFNDGREVPDHVYALFEYPGGVTATFSSIESNAFDERYEGFYGTKGTLIIRNENDAMLFSEDGGAGATGIEVGPAGAGAALEASETKPASAGGTARAEKEQTAKPKQPSPSTLEINAFCSAIRAGTPLACGPASAMHSAAWCLAANEAMKRSMPIKIDNGSLGS